MVLTALRDYFRNLTGSGISGAPWSVKRLADDATIISGTTVADTEPATALSGMLQATETALGYPGPIKYVVTDPDTGSTRVHTSKSVGLVGPWRSVDFTRLVALMGSGVVPGVGGELVATANGTNMNVTVASGVAVIRMGEHAVLYAWPSPQTVTIGASHPTLTRIDTVILRAWPPGTAQEGRIDLVVKAGVASSSPVPPELQQDSELWEYPLADVEVNAGATTIAAEKVTSRRTFCFRAPSFVAGDLLIADSQGKITSLPKGGSGQYLRQSAGIAEWQHIAAADLPSGIDAAKIGSGVVSNAEFATLDGVTSSIQGQLDAKQPLDDTLSALATLNSVVGLVTQTGADQFTKRSIVAGSGISVTDGDGVAGNPTIAVQALLAAINALASNGLIARTGAGTAAARSIAAGSGISVTNGDGAAGNPTIALTPGHLGDYLFFRLSHQSGSDTSSTTSTTTFSTAMDLQFTLPAGTWTVRAMSQINLRNDGSHSSVAVTSINTTDGSTVTRHSGPFSSPDYVTFFSSVAVSGLSGTVTVSAKFRSGTGGTTYATNPALWIVGVRTG